MMKFFVRQNIDKRSFLVHLKEGNSPPGSSQLSRPSSSVVPSFDSCSSSNGYGPLKRLRLSLHATSRDFRLRLSRASSCHRRRLTSCMTPARPTSRVNCRSRSPPSTSSSPASTFALWYLGLAAGAHGEVGAEAETERERATVGGDPSGKEATVVRDPSWRR